MGRDVIDLRCAQCGHQFAASADGAGGQVGCPACGTVQSMAVQSIPASGSSDWPVGGAPGQAAAAGSPFADQAGNPFAAAGDVLDSTNPYAAPAAHAEYLRDQRFGAAAGPIVPTRFDIADVFSRAWTVFQANMLNIIGACAVMVAMNMMVSMVVGGASFAVLLAVGDQSMAASLVVQFAQQVITTTFSVWLMAGVFRFYLDLGRGRPAKFVDIFSGARYLWRLLLALLLFYVAGIAVFAATLGPGFAALFSLGGSHPATIGLFVGGGLILLVFLIYVGLGISQYMFALLDQDCGVLESFRLSWFIMRGNRLSFFALTLLVGLLSIAGFLACLVGAIFTVPLGYFVIAFAYLVMTGQPTAETMYRAPA